MKLCAGLDHLLGGLAYVTDQDASRLVRTTCWLFVCASCTLKTARVLVLGVPWRTKEDGSISYTPMVEFTNREAVDRFRDAVLETLDRLQGGMQ
jgi:hypothetical protein